MSEGLLLVNRFFPDMFHINIPSIFLLSVGGREARLSIIKHLRGLELSDLTNSVVRDPGVDSGFKLEHENLSFDNVSHILAAAISQEEIDQQNPSALFDSEKFHKVSFDIRNEQEGLYRAFATKFFTKAEIIHAIPDIDNVTPEDKAFHQSVMNEFVKVYRKVSNDYRPRFVEDYDEPNLVQFYVAKYSEDDSGRSIGQIQLENKKFFSLETELLFRTDLQPTAFKSPKIATDELSAYLESGKSVSTGREFLDSAIHAALHLKSFKYSLLEAFLSVEFVVSKFLYDVKLQKGVSRTKLDDYNREVSISYKLNVELPAFLENLTVEERRLIGNVDVVRRWRNDVVHNGKVPTEDEAKFAVEAAKNLFSIFLNREIEI